MKTYLILISLVCFANCKTPKLVPTTDANSYKTINHSDLDTTTKAINTVADTAEMVKNIITNKDKYLKKELWVLLNDLSIPVKSYMNINSRIDRIDGISLYFDDRENTMMKHGQDNMPTNWPFHLNIRWETPVPAITDNAVRQKGNNNGNWGSVEQEFYSKLIIGNVE
jgi:hypothetical protein